MQSSAPPKNSQTDYTFLSTSLQNRINLVQRAEKIAQSQINAYKQTHTTTSSNRPHKKKQIEFEDINASTRSNRFINLPQQNGTGNSDLSSSSNLDDVHSSNTGTSKFGLNDRRNISLSLDNTPQETREISSIHSSHPNKQLGSKVRHVGRPRKHPIAHNKKAGNGFQTPPHKAISSQKDRNIRDKIAQLDHVSNTQNVPHRGRKKKGETHPPSQHPTDSTRTFHRKGFQLFSKDIIRSKLKQALNNLKPGITSANISTDTHKECASMGLLELISKTQYGPVLNNKGYLSFLVTQCEDYKLEFYCDANPSNSVSCRPGMQMLIPPNHKYKFKNDSNSVSSMILAVSCEPLIPAI